VIEVVERFTGVEPVKGYHLQLWPHQKAMMFAPWIRRECGLFFDIAGFGAGKSFAIVLLILALAERYWDKQVTIAVGSETITRLRKTVIIDLINQLSVLGWAYNFNAQLGVLRIGAMQFMFVATGQPELIYGYTCSAFLVDELDELKQEDALLCFRRVSERTRKSFPDGRAPFRAYFTTANGYKGTYQIICDLQDKKTPYFHVRGETKENLANDPSYYWQLYNSYNEMQRQAWLEGRFVNLTTGRVYYGYDESVNMLKTIPFTIQPNDLIRVGQDFNFGYSCGTATVKRDGKIYVVKLWSFAEIGHAAKMIRTDFPNNQIEWYPDATAPEIVKGIAKEFRQYGIEIRMGKINPSVVDRIFFLNYLFEHQLLYLLPNCGPLSMALKLRQFNDKGDPEKGKGPDAPDHRCDSLEYVIWRIVSREQEYQDLWNASRIGRKNITDRQI
jgi:hypothetical protein